MFVADSFIPIPVPDNHDDINFTPLILKSKVLFAVLVFEFLCVAAIITIRSCTDAQNHYHTTYSHIRLVVTYVPTIVGTITTLVFRSLRDTFARIQPYISMADHGTIRQPECRGPKSVGQLFMRGLRLNDRGTWVASRNRHSLRLATVLCNFLAIQIAGYKASLFSTAHSDEG